MSAWPKFLPAIALALLLAVGLGVSILRVNMGNENTSPQQNGLAATTGLGYAGIDPNSLSLNWTMSTDPTFVEYDLQRFSTTLFGWETIAALAQRTDTSFLMTGLDPGSSNSWRIIYQDTSSSSISASLPTTQPPRPSLSIAMSTDTNASFHWTNSASYGGLLHFLTYQIIASINDAKNATFTSIPDAGTLSFNPPDLLASTAYAFYLNVTDECSGAVCPTIYPFTSSLSNKVTVNTPGPLVANQIVAPLSVDIGEPVGLSCLASGGIAPYTYSWSVGDGTTGATGDRLTHIFTISGTFPVKCTVTDAVGTNANAAADPVQVIRELSINSFTASPTHFDMGQKLTLNVDAVGGNGTLTYSYSGLPPGCLSLNTNSITCTPKENGNYDVTVTITDQGHETAVSTAHVSIAPAQVLGLSPTTGLTIVYGSISATIASAVVAMAIVLRKRTRQAPPSQQKEPKEF